MRQQGQLFVLEVKRGALVIIFLNVPASTLYLHCHLITPLKHGFTARVMLGESQPDGGTNSGVINWQ